MTVRGGVALVIAGAAIALGATFLDWTSFFAAGVLTEWSLWVTSSVVDIVLAVLAVATVILALATAMRGARGARAAGGAAILLGAIVAVVAAQHAGAGVPSSGLAAFVDGDKAAAQFTGRGGIWLDANEGPALVALLGGLLAAAGGGLLLGISLGRVRATAIELGGGPRRGRVPAATVAAVLALAGLVALAAGDRGHPEIQIIR